jgi:hypothetical protein
MSPSLSPETGHVVSKSGLGLGVALAEFVPSARTAGEVMTNAAVKMIPATSFKFFILF